MGLQIMRYLVGISGIFIVAVALVVSIMSGNDRASATVEDPQKALSIMFSINMNLTKRIEEIEKRLKITPPKGSYKLVNDPKEASQ